MRSFIDDVKKEFQATKEWLSEGAILLYELILSIIGLNFLIFFIITFIVGGDAAGGKIENEKYYLNMKGHLTEVSEWVYIYSKYHGLSVSWSFFIFLGAPGIFIIIKAGVKRLLTRQASGR